jgi:pSer/pThr/pTyr-binding forkhead associated (FHA) protein
MHVKLLVVHGRPQGKCLEFPSGEYVFGRGAECHIRPNSDWVSRQHCMLRVSPDALVVRDLGSRNGTLVNGVRVRGERRLGNGDQLQVGPLVFEVRVEETGDVPAPPASPSPSTQDTGTFTSVTSDDLPCVTAGASPPPTRELPALPAKNPAVPASS